MNQRILQIMVERRRKFLRRESTGFLSPYLNLHCTVLGFHNNEMRTSKDDIPVAIKVEVSLV